MEKEPVHPTIQKFLDEKNEQDFGVGEYQYNYGKDFIRFSARLEKNQFMKPMMQGLGFLFISILIGVLRQTMSDLLGVTGLYIHSILLIISLLPVAFFGFKAVVLILKYLLSGGDDGPGEIDVEIRFKGNKVEARSALREDFKYWSKLVAYFKSIHS